MNTCGHCSHDHGQITWTPVATVHTVMATVHMIMVRSHEDLWLQFTQSWSDHMKTCGHRSSCDLTMTVWTAATGLHVIWPWSCEQWPWLCEQWPQVFMWSDHDHVNSGHRCSCDLAMTVWTVATGVRDQGLHNLWWFHYWFVLGHYIIISEE